MARKHPKLKQRVAVLPILMTQGKHGKKGKNKKERKIYMITSRQHDTWIIPTGKFEKNLSSRRVALLEAFEEAGILGKLDAGFKMKVLMDTPCGKKKRKTTVYLLHVKRILKHWPEEQERERKAVSLKYYVKAVSDKNLKRKLLAF